MTELTPKIKDFTGQEGTVRLKDVLEPWPLYRKLQYSGAEESVVLPADISLFCPRCSNFQRWSTNIIKEGVRSGMRPVPPTKHKAGFGLADYKCQNCVPPPSCVRYYFYWLESNGVS